MLHVHGIPTCGTVKKALAWLTAHHVPHRFVDFRTTPPSRAEVERWVTIFGAQPLRNTSGNAYRALGPEKDTWTDAQWTDAFTADPMLIRRPVITRSGVPVLVGFRGDDAALMAALGG